MMIQMKNEQILMAALVGVMVLLVGCQQSSSPKAVKEPAGSDVRISISVELQFNGHGEDQTLDVEVAEGATVFGALKQMEADGQISAKLTGAGETGFVSSIGGVALQKGGGDGWTFRVNDELGKIGSDLYTLSEGDHVIWRYGKYKPE